MPSERPRALVIDDDPSMQKLVASTLDKGGFDCETTGTATDAHKLLEQAHFDLLIIDRKLPDADGVRLLRQIRSMGISTPAIVITAHPSLDSAVGALQLAAFDYLVKPFDWGELLEKAERAVSDQALVDENLFLWHRLEEKHGWQHVMSRNPSTQQTYITAAKAAATNAPVLIEGETGTGKEYLARAIHYLSDRADGPLVVLNCGGFPDELIENELFGHEKGAFTSANSAKVGLCEIAGGGTLFLDEISQMSPAMQAKLLRFVEDHSFTRLGGTEAVSVDVRITTASNQRLPEMVESGQFREDLYYRLNVIPLHLPPLRDRPEDIEPFTEHFIEQFSCTDNKKLAEEAWAKLRVHTWPGNLRELRNVIQRAGILAIGNSIEREDLIIGTDLARSSSDAGIAPDQAPLHSSLLPLAEVKKQHILAAVEACDGDRAAAAEILGISRSTMDRQLAKYEKED